MTLSKEETTHADDVDLALVIALDVSFSVDNREFKLMRNGLASALDTPEVEKALLTGYHGAILICVMQWSGYQEQDISINWIRVSNRNDLAALAGKCRRMSRRYSGGATDIGGAINYCRNLILDAPIKSIGKVIDLVGDGTNNVNLTPSIERDLTVAAGITINGLAITNTVDDLVTYYRTRIIGGNGAFVEVAAEYTDFEDAMRKKLAREMQSLLS